MASSRFVDPPDELRACSEAFHAEAMKHLDAVFEEQSYSTFAYLLNHHPIQPLPGVSITTLLVDVKPKLRANTCLSNSSSLYHSYIDNIITPHTCARHIHGQPADP
jgi:hypothetical protein